jgi:hypothetical protein
MGYSNLVDYAVLVASLSATFVNVYLYRLLVQRLNTVIRNTTPRPVVAPPKSVAIDIPPVITPTSPVAYAFVSDVYMGGAHPLCSKCKLRVAKFQLQPDGSAICQNCLNGNL